jgi:hypothetical protein
MQILIIIERMKRMAKKTAKKAEPKKAVKKAKVKDEGDKRKSEYGHLLSKQSGYIDICLASGTPIDKIAKEWDKAHPGNPMKFGRVKGHLNHLVEEHGFSKTTAQQLLAANKAGKESKKVKADKTKKTDKKKAS